LYYDAVELDINNVKVTKNVSNPAGKH
jgi:dynein heavy chain, axonemal